MTKGKWGLEIFALLTFFSCESSDETLFTRLDPDRSGIAFENIVEETPAINILTYEYTYNGGGVAAGDFNNDGLCDLYFSGNAVYNRLYINNGDLKFIDVTEKAGVSGRTLWKTGVSAADINADGWLDLYVCYSGPDSTYNLSNQLFINNGVAGGGEPTFTESAAAYGLDAANTFSTQSSFLDYDRDGDLDMFLLNHGNHFYSPFTNTNLLRNMRHPQFGNRLYRNEMIAGGKPTNKPWFVEVSTDAGIHGGGINFGLGVSISDVNADGWPDIFVTNDYEEQDFLYINNGDGTFRDATKKAFGHLSRNGMGTDIADYTNDGLPDLMEVDMWPEDNYRQKLLKGPDDFSRYNLMVDSGFHHQQMRNTLQMNSGVDKNGNPVFCEIGQLAGVSSTDWSWAPLFMDADNDGLKDLFVTNGYLRDFTSMDFLKFTVAEAKAKSNGEGKELELYKLVGKMPSTKTSDYIFRNNGDMTFRDHSAEWGIQVPNLSFGACYADLDNDGDLEIIVNNTNEKATVWINHSREQIKNNYLQINLQGPKGNPFGVGAKVVVETDVLQMQEQYPARGFQSSVDPIVHFGLGKMDSVRAVSVTWADGKVTRVIGVSANQRITMKYLEAVETQIDPPARHHTFLTDITEKVRNDFVHIEGSYNDYDVQPLLPYMLSRLGPALASGDVNGDSFDDFFIGGAIGQGGELFLSDGQGTFNAVKSAPWKMDAASEDIGAVFFDADGDRDLDLFVVSGGNEYPVGSPELDDRLYLNNRGNFMKAPPGSIVADHASGSCVVAADYDNDGDDDLYIGGRILPGNFPESTPGAILRNDTDRKSGKVRFTVATNEVNADLRQPGMVTDALWTDFDGDGAKDLIVVGDWMPVRLFRNESGKLKEVHPPSLKNSSGLWKRIVPADIDNDGDIDFVLGNAGNNLPWKVSEREPLTIDYGDFNGDSRLDPIMSSFVGGKQYPVASRDELLFQITSLRKKFTNYDSYARATVTDVIDSTALRNAKKLTVQNLNSSILLNLGGGNFELRPLPLAAQVSSVSAIVINDFDENGTADILLAGNFFPYRTQYGPSDASNGLLLSGDGKGKFVPISFAESGLCARGDVRGMLTLRGEGRTIIAVSRNNDSLSFYEYSKKSNNRQVAKSH